MEDPDWFPEYLEFFIYGSTIRFFVILFCIIIVNLVFTWFFAFNGFLNGWLNTPTLIFFLTFSFLKEFCVIAGMGIYKSGYDNREHPRQKDYSIGRCVLWYWAERGLPKKKVVTSLTECDICNVRDDTDKVCVNCDKHFFHAACLQDKEECPICNITA